MSGLWPAYQLIGFALPFERKSSSSISFGAGARFEGMVTVQPASAPQRTPYGHALSHYNRSIRGVAMCGLWPTYQLIGSALPSECKPSSPDSFGGWRSF